MSGLSSEKDLNVCADCHVAEVAGYYDSQHKKKGVLTCLGCHDVHAGSKASPNVKNNDVCLRCHNDMGFGDDIAVEAHTFHAVDPVETRASRCVTCHLPPLWRNDARLTHSLWPVSPRDTVEQIDAGLNPRPNSCVGVPGCHDGTVVTAPVFTLESRYDNELARILYEDRYGSAMAGDDIAVK
jgi:predicted CXXCH cytochrome family protein